MLTDRWTAKSAHGHTKQANTPGKKKKWAKIAEGLRQKGMEEGRAIRIANAAVGDRFWDGDFFRRREFNDWLDKKIKRYNAKGQSEGYFETEEGDAATVDADNKKKEEPKPMGRSKCPECEGRGVVHGKTCQACGGDGWVDDEEKLRRQSMAGGSGSSGGGGGKKDSKDAFPPGRRRKQHRPNEGGEEVIEPIVRPSHIDYRAPFTDAVYDREFSAEQRQEAASKGHALPGGGFPIRNKEDLANARQALGRAKNRGATIKLIKRRAKALGVELPENWPDARSVDSRCQIVEHRVEIVG